MKVLVTGAAGFLGTKLCSSLEAEGHDVIRVRSSDHDLCDSRSLDSLDQPQDMIFHLAAWTQAGDFCLRHPGEQWVKNQQINTTVLAWWARCQRNAKLISIGTSCAYDPSRPLIEANYLKGEPIDGLYTYAMAKRMLHIGQIALNQQYGYRFLTVVPSTLYGPGYHTDGRQMHFIFDLIRKILRAKLGGPAPVLWGDGHQRRELIHVDDFVRTLLHLSGSVDNDLINIGAGEEYSIRHFAAEICELVGYDFDRIMFDTSGYVGATSKCLHTDKLKRIYPEHAVTPLRAGLAETIDWFLANQEKVIF